MGTLADNADPILADPEGSGEVRSLDLGVHGQNVGEPPHPAQHGAPDGSERSSAVAHLVNAHLAAACCQHPRGEPQQRRHLRSSRRTRSSEHLRMELDDQAIEAPREPDEAQPRATIADVEHELRVRALGRSHDDMVPRTAQRHDQLVRVGGYPPRIGG